MTVVSVCILCTRPDQIEETIDSIERSDQMEILVGSIGDMNLQLPRCEIISIDEDCSIPESRNRLIEESEGSYIAILDDDDRWVDGRLERSLSVLRSGVECVGSLEHQNVETQSDTSTDIERSMCLTHSSMMFKNRWRYRENFILSEDADLIMRILSEGHQIIALDERLVERDLTDSHQSDGGDDRQDLLFGIARIFYRQRVRFDQDGYESWSLPTDPSLEEIEESMTDDVMDPPPLPIEPENKIKQSNREIRYD